MTRKSIQWALVSVLGLVLVSPLVAGSGEKKPITPDLAAAAQGRGWTLVNRTVTTLAEGSLAGVRLSESGGDGAAWLDGVEFGAGTIEFDVRGKDQFQRSFVGVAFHGLDDRTYDAVYFRPFNFRNPDPARRNHAVQYISHPENTWQKLRTEKPEQYEKPVTPVPDPNGWFHARVVVMNGEVKVFVNNAAEPSLVVRQLSSRGKGRVGLWCGTTSGGDFANLTITPAD